MVLARVLRALVHVLIVIRFIFWVILLFLGIAWIAGAQIEPWTFVLSLIFGAIGSTAKYLETRTNNETQVDKSAGHQISQEAREGGEIGRSGIQVESDVVTVKVKQRAISRGRIMNSPIKIGKSGSDQKTSLE